MSTLVLRVSSQMPPTGIHTSCCSMQVHFKTAKHVEMCHWPGCLLSQKHIFRRCVVEKKVLGQRTGFICHASFVFAHVVVPFFVFGTLHSWYLQFFVNILVNILNVFVSSDLVSQASYHLSFDMKVYLLECTTFSGNTL